MRIAILTAEYPPLPGGVGDYTARLVQALTEFQETELELAVLTIQDAAMTLLEVKAGSSSRTVLGQASRWGWSTWPLVGHMLAGWRPDLLHIQYQTGAYGMHPAINLLPAWLRRSGSAPKLVVTMHDLLLPYLAPRAGWLREWVTYRLMADCDALIVTNSDDMQRLQGKSEALDADQATLPIYQARRRLPQRIQPRMIPIGSNIACAPVAGYERETWRQRLGAGPETVLLAYFGLVSHTKGLDTILDALEQLPNHVYLLVIGGEAAAPQDQVYAEQLTQRIRSDQLQGRVHITGHCAPEEVSAYLLAADIGVLPFSDGASFRRGSLLAALTHGLPVITTRPARQLSSVPQLVDGQNSVLIPPQDAEALAAAISRLAREPARRALLSQGAKQLAACFSWPDIAAQHMQVYTG